MANLRTSLSSILGAVDATANSVVTGVNAVTTLVEEGADRASAWAKQSKEVRSKTSAMATEVAIANRAMELAKDELKVREELTKNPELLPAFKAICNGEYKAGSLLADILVNPKGEETK